MTPTLEIPEEVIVAEGFRRGSYVDYNRRPDQPANLHQPNLIPLGEGSLKHTGLAI
jgi:hypothetical protein